MDTDKDVTPSVDFLAVGTEETTGRKLFTVSSSGGSQYGVYLDTCVAILIVDVVDRFWVFWLGTTTKDADQRVRGHAMTGGKSEVERGQDVLVGFKRDLVEYGGYPRKNLHLADSLDQARKILVDQLKVTPETADASIIYLENLAE